MRIYAPVICPHPNYVGGDSVTMFFLIIHTIWGKCFGSDFLGQYLPWAISGAFRDCRQKSVAMLFRLSSKAFSRTVNGKKRSWFLLFSWHGDRACK